MLIQPRNESSGEELCNKCGGLLPSKYICSDSRQIHITDVLILFLSHNLVPLTILENEFFRNLVQALNPQYTLPDPSCFSSTVLHPKCEAITTQLLDQLQQAGGICVTISVWPFSHSQQVFGFLGITANYLSSWTLRKATLAFKRFRESPKASGIYSEYLDVVNAYLISDKVSHTTTSSAPWMMKALEDKESLLSLPGYEQVEGHNDADNDNDCSSSLSSEYTNFLSQMSNLIDFLPNHDPSFAHALQNTLRDSFKDADLIIKKIITKAAAVAAYIEKHTHASEYFQEFPIVRAAKGSKWNRQLKAIRFLVNIPSAVIDKFTSPHILTKYERYILSDLLEILSPFEEAFDLLENQNGTTSSLVVPITRGLLCSIYTLELKFKWKLFKALKSSVEKYLSPYEERYSFLFAAVLDPRYKMTWCYSEKEINSLTEMLTTNVTELCREMTRRDPIAPSPNSRPNLFSYMEKSGASPQPSGAPDIEVASYLAQPIAPSDEDPLLFWKIHQHKYPGLAKVAERYLCVPALSAPVESFFTNPFLPESITDSTLEQFVMIATNTV